MAPFLCQRLTESLEFDTFYKDGILDLCQGGEK